MRFATKILLLMISITVGLSAIVVLIVTNEVTARERARANDSISDAADAYFLRLRSKNDQIGTIVRLLMEDAHNRAMFDQLTPHASPEDRESAEAQIEQYLFLELLQTEESEEVGVPPAFHVLVDAGGSTLASAAIDEHLDQTLRESAINWPADSILTPTPAPEFQPHYIWLRERLYLVFGVPLRQQLSDDSPPAHAYFAGFEVDDRWIRLLLNIDQLRAAVAVWFVVDERVIARGAGGGATRPRDSTLAALLERIPLDDSSRGLRPISFESAGEQFEGQYALLALSPDVRGIFALASSLDQALLPLRRLQRNIALAAVGVVLLAIAVSQVMSRMLAKPVEQLVAGTERIARGEFNVPIDTTRRDELGTLARSFNQMAAGLEQRDLIKDTFGKFVDPKIVQSMLDDPTRLKLGGERRVQTILFSDLENFTAISEKLDPETLFTLLNGYLEDAADVVAAHRGIIDKFVGDGVVAFWGPPLEENHAVEACRAALDLVARTRLHDHAWRQLGLPPMRVRIGIATGEVLIGNIGSRSKYNYTVMGDVANLASRLEGVNKLYGTQILATDRTAQDAGDAIIFRQIDTVRVIGRSEPVALYEVMGDLSSDPSKSNGRVEAYAAALELYRSRRWGEALEAFNLVDDPPSRAMAGRCQVLIDQNPAAGWDGVWNLDRK